MRIAISRLEPEVLYAMADFMDFEGQSDEGMRSQCVYEAMETADVWSEDGKPQVFNLDMGMSLPRIKVRVNFQQVDEETWETDHAEILKEESQNDE